MRAFVCMFWICLYVCSCVLCVCVCALCVCFWSQAEMLTSFSFHILLFQAKSISWQMLRLPLFWKVQCVDTERPNIAKSQSIQLKHRWHRFSFIQNVVLFIKLSRNFSKCDEIHESSWNVSKKKTYLNTKGTAKKRQRRKSALHSGFWYMFNSSKFWVDLKLTMSCSTPDNHIGTMIL